MLPPSRGRRKAGAFAPSAKADLPAAGAAALAPGGLLAGSFPAPDFAAAAFDRAGPLGAAAAGDFNCFDGALCEAPLVAFAVGLAALLPDLPAVALRVFEAGFFAAVADPVPAAFPEVGLGDFLRVFLDIRLPFVAFGGSTMGIAGLVPASRNHADCWASLMAAEYGYKEFDAPPIRSLNVLLGSDDE